MTTREEEIVALMQAKDRRAVSMIYDDYSRQLYGLSLKMMGNQEDASEVLQLAFIKIWERAQSYDPTKAALFTWLYQVTRNTALDELRKGQRKLSKEIQITDRDVYIIEEGFENDSYAHLKSTVSGLDHKFQEVLNSVYFKGMTHVEAAEHLNLPLGTVKTRLRNALQELRSHFKTILVIFASLFS